MVKKIFFYAIVVAIVVVVYVICTPPVWSKSSAIEKCKEFYETEHGKLNAIAEFVDTFEYRDSSFIIYIRGSDGVVSLDLYDSTRNIKNRVEKENILPNKIHTICRDLNISEIKSMAAENYFRLGTGAFSN